MKTVTKLSIGLAILVILSPLGLIVPKYFKAGPAWGEWGADKTWSWKAPLHDYKFSGWEEKGLPRLSLAYIISAVIGIAIIVVVVLIIGKILTKKGE